MNKPSLKLHDLVKELLESMPETRNSDYILLFRVCEELDINEGTAILDRKFADVLINHNLYDVPNFETVRRIRQKIQHDNPDLRGCDEVQRRRKHKQEIYRNYARL